MSVLSKTLTIVDNIQQTWIMDRCLVGDSLCSSHRTRISCLREEAGNRRGSDELQVHFCWSNLTSAQCYLAGLYGGPFDIVEIAISFCLWFFDWLELRPSFTSVQGARACKGQTCQEWKSFGFKICLDVPLWLPLSFYVSKSPCPPSWFLLWWRTQERTCFFSAGSHTRMIFWLVESLLYLCQYKIAHLS